MESKIAGALGWWREAGVDFAFHDEPAVWISPAQPTAREGARAREAQHAPPLGHEAAPSPSPSPERWPADLALFAEWWLTEPWLDDGRSGGRVPPRGPREPRLMVLVPEPEREDRERLLSGAQGRLLAAMLAAMGVGEDEIYLASALPRPTPVPDWERLAAQGLGRVLTHHVGLVHPTRLLALGSDVLSLLGHDLPNNPADRREFDSQGLRIPLLGTRSLGSLLARPVWKAEVWQAWLDWTA